MKKVSIILMLVAIISKIFGFARDITLSYFFGASNITDAYLVSTTIPGVIFAFIGVGISTGYIPMYSRIVEEEGNLAASKYTSNLINILIILTLVLFIFGQVFAESLIKIFAFGFRGEILSLAAKFTRISLTGMIFAGLIYIFSGYLQIKGSYIVPALVGFPLNITTILAIIVASKGNPYVLAIGSVLAILAQLIFMMPALKRHGYKHRFILNFKDRHIKNMLRIVLPIIAGTSVNQINVLVDRTIASTIVTGGISTLNYANRLNSFVQGIFVASIVVVLYPTISRMAAEKNIEGLKRSVSEAINSINLLLLPATMGMMFFSGPIVNMLFKRGQFDENAAAMTSSALFFYAIGIVGFGLREVLSRTFYSFQDTKTPAINAGISVVINIILNIILSRYLGIGGLALATSISALLCTGLMFISLRKRIGSFGFKNIAINFIKILSASLFMGIMARYCFNYLTISLSQNFSLIISIMVGVFLYALVIYFMRIKEVDTLIANIKNKVLSR